MPNGFQAFGDNGQKQIDEFYRNMALIRKSRINTVGPDVLENSPSWRSWYLGWQYYTATSTRSILALRCDTYVTVMQASRINADGSVTYLIATAEDRNGSFFPWQGPVDVYEFGPPPLTSAHGAGIQAFNENSELCFSSDFKYMRIASYKSMSPGGSTDEFINNNFVIDPSRVYAICFTPGLCNIDSYQDLPGQFQNTIIGYFVRTNVQGGYNSNIGIIYNESGSSGALGISFGYFTLLAIDVSNY